MRVGFKCVLAAPGANTDIDRSPAQFAESLGYGRHEYATAADFLAFHGDDWKRELHAVLRELLDKRRSILSIGSGECEHELPFVLDGYDIVSTDIVDSAAQTRLLFPRLRFERFDALNPRPIGSFDDVLVTGCDSYFDDADLSRLIGNVAALLRPGGRVLFVLRYRDNLATWLIDGGVRVSWALLSLAGAVRLTAKRWVLKRHGYRRSIREVTRLGVAHGFRLGRVRHAGFGVELRRIYFERFFPRIYAAARAFDRRLHWFNNAVIFEFLT